eukprot:2936608-Alexandrium_andersonii.AAC.1
MPTALAAPCVEALAPRVVLSPCAADLVRDGVLDGQPVTLFPADRAGRERCVNLLQALDEDGRSEPPCLAVALDADGSSLAALASALAPVAAGRVLGALALVPVQGGEPVSRA